MRRCSNEAQESAGCFLVYAALGVLFFVSERMAPRPDLRHWVAVGLFGLYALATLTYYLNEPRTDAEAEPRQGAALVVSGLLGLATWAHLLDLAAELIPSEVSFFVVTGGMLLCHLGLASLGRWLRPDPPVTEADLASLGPGGTSLSKPPGSSAAPGSRPDSSHPLPLPGPPPEE